MHAGSRFALALALPLVVLSGIAYAAPDLAAGLVPDLWDDAGAGRAVRAQQELRERLERADEAALRRVAARHRVVAELLEGRMTLAQAAAWFRFLNEESAASPELRARAFPGRSEGERLCHQVITWAGNELHATGPESRARAVVDRLEAELRAELAAGGGDVRLPEGQE